MSYTINIPLDVPLQFPDLCPYSGQPDTAGTIRLSKTTTSMILPIPGVGLYNRYRKSSFAIPVARSVARRFQLMRLLPALCILAAAAIVVWLNVAQTTPLQNRVGAIACILAVPLAGLAQLVCWWSFRQVRLGAIWETHLEVRFRSEDFARQFSELNRLPIVE